MFKNGAKYARNHMNNVDQTDSLISVKALTNFLESSMVPAEATFLGLHPRKG